MAKKRAPKRQAQVRKPTAQAGSIALVDKLEHWEIDDPRLKIYERNSRTHSDQQIAEIAASYRAYGMNNPILWHPKIRITAGAGRFRAAKLAELKRIPVIRLDHLSEAQARAYLIADNKLPEHAGWDQAILRDELRALEALGEDLAPIGFSEAELEALLPDVEGDQTEGEGDGEEKGPHEPLKFESDGTDRTYRIQNADCLEYLKKLPPDSLDSLVTDPPAGISFMGKEWDDDKGGRKQWTAWLTDVMQECRRVLKPGAHALVWAIPRTSHWTGTALENAGFEIRDCVYHLFGSGFPKSLDVSKAIDKANGDERPVIGKNPNDRKKNSAINFNGKGGDAKITSAASAASAAWEGWGTALKPAAECWWLARKPLSEDIVAANVLKWGTGAININSCRIGTDQVGWGGSSGSWNEDTCGFRKEGDPRPIAGRFPANLVLSHSPGCVELGTKKVKGSNFGGHPEGHKNRVYGKDHRPRPPAGYADENGEETVSEWNCVDGCPVAELDRQSGKTGGGSFKGPTARERNNGLGLGSGVIRSGASGAPDNYGDTGGASRFFYVVKPANSEKQAGMGGDGEADEPNRNAHPTIKPVRLMQYFCRMVTPPGGTVLDVFAGSGTTGIGALAEGFNFIGIEKEPESAKTARKRIRTAFPCAVDENKK